MKHYLLLAFVIASLIKPSGLQAQYRWTITHPDTVGSYSYDFNYVDCSGDACTAVGLKINDTLSPPELAITYKLAFFRSDDGGSTWREQDPGFDLFGTSSLQDAITQVQQIDTRNIVAIGDTGYNFSSTAHCLIIRSFDAGRSWNVQFDSVFPVGAYFNIHFSDSATGIATFGNKIFTTNDAGNHWVKAPFFPYYACGASHSYGGGKFRVAPSGNGRLYHTLDSWATVDSTSSPFIMAANESIYGYGFYGNDTIEAAAMPAGKPPVVVLRSIDGGFTWQTIDTLAMTYASSAQTVFSSLGGPLVFLSGLRASVLPVSTDRGNSWHVDTLIADPIAPVKPNLPYFPLSITFNAKGTAVAAMNISPNRIIATPGFLAQITPAGGGSVASGIHPRLSIVVFPNPATKTITIVPHSGPVIITDPIGRSYSVHASGSSWDISSLPPGFYFVINGAGSAKLVKE